MDDPLKQFLLQGSWSYEDILKKLEQYKNENVIKSTNEINESTNILKVDPEVVLDDPRHSENVITSTKQNETIENDTIFEVSDESVNLDDWDYEPENKIIKLEDNELVNRSNDICNEEIDLADNINKYCDIDKALVEHSVTNNRRHSTALDSVIKNCDINKNDRICVSPENRDVCEEKQPPKSVETGKIAIPKSEDSHTIKLDILDNCDRLGIQLHSSGNNKNVINNTDDRTIKNLYRKFSNERKVVLKKKVKIKSAKISPSDAFEAQIIDNSAMKKRSVCDDILTNKTSHNDLNQSISNTAKISNQKLLRNKSSEDVSHTQKRKKKNRTSLNINRRMSLDETCNQSFENVSFTIENEDKQFFLLQPSIPLEINTQKPSTFTQEHGENSSALHTKEMPVTSKKQNKSSNNYVLFNKSHGDINPKLEKRKYTSRKKSLGTKRSKSFSVQAPGPNQIESNEDTNSNLSQIQQRKSVNARIQTTPNIIVDSDNCKHSKSKSIETELTKSENISSNKEERSSNQRRKSIDTNIEKSSMQEFGENSKIFNAMRLNPKRIEISTKVKKLNNSEIMSNNKEESNYNQLQIDPTQSLDTNKRRPATFMSESGQSSKSFGSDVVSSKAISIIDITTIYPKKKPAIDILGDRKETCLVPSVAAAVGKGIESKKFNTSRLNNITNILLQKLSSTQENKRFSDQFHSNETPSEDLGFKIVNVVGGYTSPTHEPEHTEYAPELPPVITENKTTPSNKVEVGQNANNTETKKYKSAIMPTKTEDVTKIKGWKKKHFATENNLIEDNKQSKLNETSKSTENVITVKQNPLKSAFTSDILEEYLNEHADLNISYEVPKLVAEQTLKQTYIDIQFPNYTIEPVNGPDLPQKKDGMKPKTLAEKRRMEQIKTSHYMDFVKNMSPPQLKKYLAETSKIRKKLIDKEIPFTRRCFMTSVDVTSTGSCVMFNGTKLKVASTKANQIVESIKDEVKPRASSIDFVKIQTKPSLLKSLEKNFYNNPVEWEDVKVKLPKIFLDVIPQIGKRIHPKIQHLIKSDSTVLDTNRVDFALSTLKIKDEIWKPQKFVFPLIYNFNKKSVCMKKRIKRDVVSDATNTTCNESEYVITESCKEVISKLLDYFDRLDETKDIIQEDDFSIGTQKPTEKQNVEATHTVLKQKERTLKAFKRTETEIKRLSCKLLSISTGDELDPAELCKKDYCDRGCICNSIEGNFSNLLQQAHCGKYNCMFKCICKNRPFSESGPFSQGVINRLQNEATKNLAKVEKEFTQTLIKTNNQLILVGDSNERRKRTPKIPKKFHDYVESELLEKNQTEPEIPKLPEKSFLVYEDMVIPSCYIKLFKYNFNDIIPYCMAHSLYKCYCRFDGNEVKPLVDKIITPIRTNVVSKTPLVKLKKKNKKLVGYQPWDKDEHTSRSGGIMSSLILFRNTLPTHRERIKKSTRKLEKKLKKYLTNNALEVMDEGGLVKMKSTKFPLTLDDTDPKETPTNNFVSKDTVSAVRDYYENNEISIEAAEKTVDVNVDIDKMQPVTDDKEIHREKEINTKRKKNGIGKELKLQRRRFKLTAKRTKTVQKRRQPKSFTNDAEKKKLIQSLAKEVEREKLIESLSKEAEKEYLKFLANHSSQVRILPWSQLITKYESGTYQLWCSDYSQNSLVTVTESNQRPSIHHYNITFFESNNSHKPPCNIVKYIANKETPFGKSKDKLLIILLETNQNVWKICGLCEKNETNTNDNLSLSIVQFYGNVEVVMQESNQIYTSSESTTPSVKSPTVSSVSTKQKTIEKPRDKKVSLCKKHFTSKVLNIDSFYKSDTNIVQNIEACLPNISPSCKWKVICISERFVHISFLRCDFVLDYDDIVNALSAARKWCLTVTIRSSSLRTHYPHRNFGIYCDYHVSDKIFVGPYFTNENHDLKFIFHSNKSLVDTQNGLWYRQSRDSNYDSDVEVIPPPETLIDLTYDSDNEETISQNSNDQSPEILETKTAENNLTQESTSIEETGNANLKGSPRYIITNIPDVGYIEAYLHNNGLDVILCPVTRTPRRFTHWSTAITSLSRIMTARFIFVPSNFKLEVTMVEELDAAYNKPMNKTILNGCYVAGEFGVKHIANITQDDLNDFGLSQYETVGLLQIRERKLLQLIIMHLSKLLKIEVPMETPSFSLLMKLADKTLSEVNLLKQQAESHVKEQSALEKEKKSLMAKCMYMIGSLPLNKRSKEIEKINEILKSSTSNHPVITNDDIISIEDDRNQNSGKNYDDQEDSSNKDSNNIETFTPTPTDLQETFVNQNRIQIIHTNPNLKRKKVNLTLQNSCLYKPIQPKPAHVILNADNSGKNTITPIVQNFGKSTTLTSPVKNSGVPVHILNLGKNTLPSLLPLQKSVLKQKLSTSRQLVKANLTPVNNPKSVLSTVPVLSKIVIPGTSKSTQSIASQNNMVKTVSAVSPVALSTVKIGKSTYLSNSNAQNMQKKNSVSMATLTSLPIKPVEKKTNPNFIALKDGSKLKYFQFVKTRKEPAPYAIVTTAQNSPTKIISTTSKSTSLIKPSNEVKTGANVMLQDSSIIKTPPS